MAEIKAVALLSVSSVDLNTQLLSYPMNDRIEPLKKEARTIRRHKELILNWLRAKGELSSGVEEGMNNKVKLAMRKSLGFREYRSI